MVTDRAFIVGVLDILFLIAPGVAVVYYFNPILFASLDWVKLTLLSLAVTAPLSFVNTIFTVVLEGVIKGNEIDLFGVLSFAINCTGVVIYITLGMSYFFAKSFHDSAMFLSIIEFALLIYSAFRARRHKQTK